MSASLRPTREQLAMLVPLAGLSRERLAELAEATLIERAARGADLLAGRARPGPSLFLLAGEVLLGFEAWSWWAAATRPARRSTGARSASRERGPLPTSTFS